MYLNVKGTYGGTKKEQDNKDSANVKGASVKGFARIAVSGEEGDV